MGFTGFFAMLSLVRGNEKIPKPVHFYNVFKHFLNWNILNPRILQCFQWCLERNIFNTIGKYKVLKPKVMFQIKFSWDLLDCSLHFEMVLVLTSPQILGVMAFLQCVQWFLEMKNVHFPPFLQCFQGFLDMKNPKITVKHRVLRAKTAPTYRPPLR